MLMWFLLLHSGNLTMLCLACYRSHVCRPSHKKQNISYREMSLSPFTASYRVKTQHPTSLLKPSLFSVQSDTPPSHPYHYSSPQVVLLNSSSKPGNPLLWQLICSLPIHMTLSSGLSKLSSQVFLLSCSTLTLSCCLWYWFLVLSV